VNKDIINIFTPLYFLKREAIILSLKDIFFKYYIVST